MALNETAAIRELTQDEWDELNLNAQRLRRRAESLRSDQNSPGEMFRTTTDPVANPLVEIEGFVGAETLLERFGSGALVNRYLPTTTRSTEATDSSHDFAALVQRATELAQRNPELAQRNPELAQQEESALANSRRHLSLVSTVPSDMTKETSWAEPVDWSDCIERDAAPVSGDRF